MKSPSLHLRHSRRRFIQGTILGSAALAASETSRPVTAALIKPSGPPDGGLKLGITSYTLRDFSLEQAIAMTKEAGAKYISLKDMHLPLRSTVAERKEARSKIESAGLVLLGGGVIYMNKNEQEIRAAFEYARDAGMPTIICSPVPEALDLVEGMAREFGIRIAIHNHGPGDKHYPSARDVLRLVKGRDLHMGICIDVGHTVRNREDPVAVIQECAERLYDFHMKDVTEATEKGRPIEVGRGIIDIVGVLRTLVKIGYAHHVALEYEDKAKAPMPGITESLGYLRGVLATL
jgi:sugar phosphate isomerase/epimerase